MTDRRSDSPIHVDAAAPTLPPIAGGSAAVVPLAVALAPVVIEEFPKIIASLMKIADLIKNHPETADAAKAQMTAVYTHLDAAAAAVAAVQV